MTAWTDFLWQPWWENVIRALLHTLWQATICAAALFAALRILPARRAQLRYGLALGALAAIAGAGIVTWAVLEVQAERAQQPVTQGATEQTARAVEFAVSEGHPSTATAVSVSAAAHEPTAITLSPVWIAVCSVTWLAGLTLMLVRLVVNVAGARRIVRRAERATPEIEDLVRRLQSQLGIVRRVRVVVTDALSKPAVWGILRPALILPTAAATGIPAEHLLAICAHELAHVRRHDLLVNLLQMLVEAVLFFNPAVWWVSRQIRQEREACCDALAVQLTGKPITYVETLADWAERARDLARPAVVAPALVPEHKPRALLDRIRRVLQPEAEPQLRMSVWGAVGVVLLGATLLLGLLHSAAQVVAVAADVISPAERIEQLRAAQREFAHPGDGADLPVTIKGTVRTADGGPLPERILFDAYSRGPSSSYSKTLEVRSSPFEFKVERGMIYLMATGAGYAPHMVRPLAGRGGETIENVEIVLDRGFRAEIKLVDEDGKPVPGATMLGGMVMLGTYHHEKYTTDTEGVAVIEHAGREPYAFRIESAGLQSLTFNAVQLHPNKRAVLEVRRAKLTSGSVVGDAFTVEGATIRLYGVKGPQASQNSMYGANGPVLATTNARGEFTLDGLVDGAEYTVVVEYGKHRRLIRGVKSGQSGLDWKLGPDLDVRGVIIGNLSRLEQRDGKPVVKYSQTIRVFENHIDSSFGGYAEVEVRDGTGTFLIRNLLEGEVIITAADQVVKRDVAQEIDYVAIVIPEAASAPVEREVVLKLVTPDGSHPADGQVAVSTYIVVANSATSYVEHNVTLEGGLARVTAPTGGKLQYRPRGLVGYWFEEGTADVPAGSDPLSIEVRVQPAGGIRGQIKVADGVVEDVNLSSIVVDAPAAIADRPFAVQLVAEPDAEGRFLLAPIPLGGTYVVKAARGKSIQLSGPLRLDDSQPIADVQLQLPVGVTLGGRVVGPADEPLAEIPLTLHFEHPQASTSYSPPTLTDVDGAFEFAGINPAVGEYWAELNLARDFVPTRARLRGDGSATTIQLKRGLTLDGQVVDKKTGWPIPGVELYAHLPYGEYQQGAAFAFEAEGVTDAEGRFHFSNLPDRPLLINDRSGLRWMRPSDDRTIAPGSSQSLVIHAALPDWSTLKPAPADAAANPP